MKSPSLTRGLAVIKPLITIILIESGHQSISLTRRLSWRLLTKATLLSPTKMNISFIMREYIIHIIMTKISWSIAI